MKQFLSFFLAALLGAGVIHIMDRPVQAADVVAAGNGSTSVASVTTTEDAATNSAYCPPFQTASGGTNPFKTDCSNYTYNPSAGRLVIKNLTISAPNNNKPMCLNSSSQIADCGTAGVPASSFALAATCGSGTGMPCAFTWTCTRVAGVCTVAQNVPANCRVHLTATTSPDVSTTNTVDYWGDPPTSGTSTTIHVSDLLGTSTGAFAGTGLCL